MSKRRTLYWLLAGTLLVSVLAVGIMIFYARSSVGPSTADRAPPACDPLLLLVEGGSGSSDGISIEALADELGQEYRGLGVTVSNIDHGPFYSGQFLDRQQDRATRVIEESSHSPIVRPRRPNPFGSPGPLTVIFHRSSTLGVRWDRPFLSPVNVYSRTAVDKMTSGSQATSYQKAIVLKNSGDTLLIDNWRCLHGRSSVPTHGSGRRIERTFLSSVG